MSAGFFRASILSAVVSAVLFGIVSTAAAQGIGIGVGGDSSRRFDDRDRDRERGRDGGGFGIGVTIDANPQAPTAQPRAVAQPRLPPKRKKTTAITGVCEMHWLDDKNRKDVECTQGSSRSCTVCQLHNGDVVIGQPATLPSGPERNNYWCGCP